MHVIHTHYFLCYCEIFLNKIIFKIEIQQEFKVHCSTFYTNSSKVTFGSRPEGIALSRRVPQTSSTIFHTYRKQVSGIVVRKHSVPLTDKVAPHDITSRATVAAHF